MIVGENNIIRSPRDNISEYRRILAETRRGKLIRLRNGLYAYPQSLMGNIVDIDAIVPGGILCLYSAWHYYDLTTQIPDAFYVAVSRSRKLVLPEIPDIKLVYQTDRLLDIGRTGVTDQGIELSITDLERSVCDAVRYRNKIGMDVMKEIIDNYLRSSQRNISRLVEYAKSLRVYTTLNQILQIKL